MITEDNGLKGFSRTELDHVLELIERARALAMSGVVPVLDYSKAFKVLLALSLVLVFGVLGNAWLLNDLRANQSVLQEQNKFTFSVGENTITMTTSELLYALVEGQNNLGNSIGNANLCGNGQFIEDSNRLNEVPRGTVYSCFIKEVR